MAVNTSEKSHPSSISIDRANTLPVGDDQLSPASWRDGAKPKPMRRATTGGLDVEDYFSGPRDMDKHSKWPFFMRLHGSVLPKMILPLLAIGAWSTGITLLNHYTKGKATVDPVLLTVLGFVVGLALSFRSSTAYERYGEGRKLWAQLVLSSQSLSRMLWIHTKEREGDEGKVDLLRKLTALNLVKAYAHAIKHKLRFEPGTAYQDIQDLIGYLDTFANIAEESGDIYRMGPKNAFKKTGEYLGVSFAESNPRKALKKSSKPLGNLPLEILNHIASYVDSLISEARVTTPIYQTTLMTAVASMNEVLIGTERVLSTPLPIAYSISISQITWVYIIMLPFQLWSKLKWVTIPGTIVAAYIILGLAAIGREIENPFGNDVNDLPLDAFCDQIEMDINIICSTPSPSVESYMNHEENYVLAPLSNKNFGEWMKRSKDDIRAALMTKANLNAVVRKSISAAATNGQVPQVNVKVADKHHPAETA